jgi:hypothetical protein
MGTIKKAKKYREGGDIECPPGAGGKCRPASSPGRSIGANVSGGKGRGNVVTKEDEEAGRKQRIGERIKSSAKKIVPQSTAPGVRGEKKGSQSFFGGDKDVSEAKHGKKVAKKSAVKKAKIGTKLIKSKKK